MNPLLNWAPLLGRTGPQGTATTSPARLLPRTRVGRALRPGQPGTIKLQRHFGPALQAVRYRYDATGLYRFTTVELVVEHAPVTRGHSLHMLFAVRVSVREAALRTALLQHGARWNPKIRRWIVNGRSVQALDLLHRVDLAAIIPGATAHLRKLKSHRHL